MSLCLYPYVAHRKKNAVEDFTKHLVGIGNAHKYWEA